MKQDQIISLIDKYDQPAPRYTSFPTAVQFKPGAPPDMLAQNLAQLDADEAISLYAHIPFCHQLCYYCGCNTTIVHNYSPITRYVDYLLREIEMVGTHLQHKQPISRIHFGGGSPNYAKIEDIRRIVGQFARYFNLSQTGLDMECDPRLLDNDTIKDLADLGFSRLSLGIQDFDPDVQAAINRIQPAGHVVKQIEQMRAAGIEHINFDLIVGLPEQTLQTISNTLDRVAELRPSRIAVFPYAHVPWMKKHQQVLERYILPNTHQRFNMTQLVHDRLTDEGYVAIGIDHYALPNDALARAHNNRTMQRNFQGYTNDPASTILGLGQSAISQLPNAYMQNTANAAHYRAHISGAELAHEKSLALTTDDKIRRALIEQIMSYFEVDLSAFPSITRPIEALRPLLQDGLVELNGDVLRVTELGRPFTRVVAACFDPYFQIAADRHAKAI